MPKAGSQRGLFVSPMRKATAAKSATEIVSKARDLEKFLKDLETVQEREITALGDEIRFFTLTLEKLRGNVSTLKIAREATIKDYISDKFSALSPSHLNKSEC
jgi:DNA integrity scanning protein DisA with diadenylate cyclase activity